MTKASLLKIDISLKRVQTFIFEVPRLKAMLGANALVGQTMRHDLSKLAIDCGSVPLDGASAPAADTTDPLQPKDQFDRDDPRALHRNGILARDGGHFMAIFADEVSAKNFKYAAEALISMNLPGVLFDIDERPLGSGNLEKGGRKAEALEAHLLELPVLQICQETGQEVASQSSQRTDERKIWAARSVRQRTVAGETFRKGKTRDIIGLMQHQLGLTQASGWQAPEDLENLCAGQYLALIHADGNGVGKRYKDWARKAPDGIGAIEREAHGEAFYHSMRVAVRKAVVQALEKIFANRKDVRPYEVLMLGGDDLLIACRADKALPFALAYAGALKEIGLVDETPLDVGIGVAIAKASYPLHRLHALAEALAASAKRLHRAKPSRGSVIDWQVVTNSWFDDVAQARRAADYRRYTVDGKEESVVLSRRPYPVLNDDGLEGLLGAVKDLDEKQEQAQAEGEEGAARSPLRALRAAFESGRRSGQMAFDRLDPKVRQILAGGNGDSPWTQLAGDQCLTRVLDIIDLREISRLGKWKK
ncbi:MAG: hypothetical protein IPN78_15085 [Candidatus Accumulibacter sp.]|nr:hypothetical protein [Candidatus Accumulibacter propinquus]